MIQYYTVCVNGCNYCYGSKQMNVHNMIGWLLVQVGNSALNRHFRTRENANVGRQFAAVEKRSVNAYKTSTKTSPRGATALLNHNGNTDIYKDEILYKTKSPSFNHS